MRRLIYEFATDFFITAENGQRIDAQSARFVDRLKWSTREVR